MHCGTSRGHAPNPAALAHPLRLGSLSMARMLASASTHIMREQLPMTTRPTHKPPTRLSAVQHPKDLTAVYTARQQVKR